MPRVGQPHLGTLRMDEIPNIAVIAVPFYIAMIIVEMIWARRHSPTLYDPRDLLTTLSMAVGNFVAGAMAAGFVIAMSFAVHEHRLFTLPDHWSVWVVSFLLIDLAYYAVHRLRHRMRWFWAAHVNHHSSQSYNLSIALRQSWTGFLSLSFAYNWPFVMLGFPPHMLFVCAGFNTFYQFWLHTQVIGKMPAWFEYVMVTPSHHRVHHAVNARHLDSNYGGTLIIWDRLFGTFSQESDEEELRYGIVRQLGGYNLLWHVFHEWIGIIRDLARAPFRAKAGYFFGPPGWSHDGSRETTDMIRARWEANQPRADLVESVGGTVATPSISAAAASGGSLRLDNGGDTPTATNYGWQARTEIVAEASAQS
jgi:sterol desaturase/sphingolipid hydroxylase (fatty acid hydroxylase superfamily)